MSKPEPKKRIMLTDKQRKWLESLSKEDRQPYPITVKRSLINGYYFEYGQMNLNKLVDKYKIKYNL